jgi:hypothetical protein
LQQDQWEDLNQVPAVLELVLLYQDQLPEADLLYRIALVPLEEVVQMVLHLLVSAVLSLAVLVVLVMALVPVLLEWSEPQEREPQALELDPQQGLAELEAQAEVLEPGQLQGQE